MGCKHINFESRVTVARLHEEGEPDNITGFSADITIVCVDCGNLFRFIGVPGGYSTLKPMVNFNGTELRAPIEPTNEKLEHADKMKMN